MKTLFFLTATLLAATQCFGDIIYDEANDGDLSSDNLNPTDLLVLAPGSSEIHGSTTFDPLDRDFWKVTIADGFQLDSIILQRRDDNPPDEDFQSWFAVEAGTQVSSLNDTTNLLGGAPVGQAVGAQVGDDVLDDLGDVPFGGTGFTGPLGPGTYTFWFQETGVDINYEFNFNVSAQVPEPSSMAACAILAIGLGFRRRTRR